jgi:hypothetical protein
MFQTHVRKNLPNVVDMCNNRTNVRKKGYMTTLTHTSVPHLRLTQRGRFVAKLAAVVGFIALLAPSISSQAQASLEQAGNRSQLIVVSPGETLWTIASRVNPEADPRAVIEEIKSLNVLEGSSLYAGQILRIPN